MAKNIHPPKLANKLLHWYCHQDLVEEIQGDTLELFSKRTKEEGIILAKRKYWWDVIRFLKWSNRKGQIPINILQTAWL